MSTTTRELFGGAITAITPTRLIDASDLRQVPETQEVFLYPDSSVSIIVEVLQRVDPVGFSDAARFHFDALAEDNSAVSSEVLEINVIPNDRRDTTPSAVVLTGVQHVPKFNSSNPDEVRIILALYRVERKNVDLVATINIPMTSDDLGAVGEEGWNTAKADFEKFVTSLRIVDYRLFA